MTHFAASWLKLLRRHQVARSKLLSSWVFPGKTWGWVRWAVTVRGKMQIIDIRGIAGPKEHEKIKYYI